VTNRDWPKADSKSWFICPVRLSNSTASTTTPTDPRLRIPVGKGHTERIIPLHPDAAAALEEVIARAKT